MKTKIILLAIGMLLSITINQAQIVRSINVSSPGNLATQIGSDKTTVTDLTLTGTINDADFETIKGMGALKKLDMGGATASNKKIPSYAFQSRVFDKLILPSGVETIGQGAFQSFQGAITLPEGLKSIDYQGFLWVRLSETLIFPNSLETIGDFAFGGAIANRGIRFGSGLKRLGRRSFDTVKASFMDFSRSVNLQEIAAGAFNNVSLENGNILDLSNSSKYKITYFSYDQGSFSAFGGHVILSDDLEEIPAYSFYRFKGSVHLPINLKTIKNRAFLESTIKEIDLPSELLNIEEKAFENCTSLQKITSRSILPANLGTSVFNGVNKTSCQLIVANESARLYRNADQWKEFLNIQGTDELNELTGPNNSDKYIKGKEGSVHIWISTGQGNSEDEGGLCFADYDFDKQISLGKDNGFQGTYKTIEVGEYEFTSQNLRAKYQNHGGDNSYERLNWTDENIAGITKLYSNESPLSIDEFGKFYGNWFNFYPNIGSYGFDNQMKFRDKEGGQELSGWGLPDLDDMAQLVGQAPRSGTNIRADVLKFLGASTVDAPVGHEGDWFNKSQNISGLTLTPLGSREPVGGTMDYSSYDFKALSRLRLKGRGRIFSITEKGDFGYHHQLFQYMQVRYTRPKTDEELGYKLYVDSCNNKVVMLPYDQKTRLTELPKGLERGIALRYANKSEMKIYKSWTAICYEADWIREQAGTYKMQGDNTEYPRLPPRPNLKYTCVDLNKPEDFEKGKEGSVHIWISRTESSKDTEGLGFEDYDFDKNTFLSHQAGMQGTYKTIEIGEYEYMSQNLRAKHHALPNTNYTWLDFTAVNVAAITKTYSQEQPLSVEVFNKFYGNWFTLLDGVQSFRVSDLVKFRDKENGTELSGWGLPELKDICQLIGQAPRQSGNLKADILSFLGASKADAPSGHEANWFDNNKNTSGLTITPLGSHHPLGNTGYLVGERPEDTYNSFKHLSRLTLKGKGEIFTFADNQDIGYNGYSAHYTQVRYNRPKTDNELGYKIFVDLEKDSIVIAPLSQDCNDNLRELSRGLERGIVLRYTNFEANKVFRSWSQVKAEATEIKYTVRNLPNTDPLLPCIPKVLVTGVTINKSRLNLNIGDRETLVATVLPEDAFNKEVTWISSNESVATVSSNGTVTAINNGVATITVTTVDGNKTATCRVTVGKEIENSNLSLSSDQNYIWTTTYTEESPIRDTSKGLNQIQYFDGLGRPVQTVQIQITPARKDLVTYQEYDRFGRESKVWLPTASSQKGGFVPLSTIENNQFPLYRGDSRPFVEPVYEESPLNRIIEQLGAGEKWEQNPVKTDYLTNNNSNLKCIQYNVSGNRNNPSLSKSKDYDSGELYVTKIADEEGYESYEFKDKLGQVVLIRQIAEDKSEKLVDHDTYYVYDDFGNLCFVLPPRIEGDISQANLDLLAYQYKYDNRNRNIAKKIPGMDWIDYVYDKADRLILTQDGAMRDNNECLATIPDELGRPALTAIYKGSVNDEKSSIQDQVVKAKYESGKYNISGLNRELSILTENFYDTYNFLESRGLKATLDYDQNVENTYGQRYTQGYKGLLTGTRTTLLEKEGISKEGEPSDLYTALYYDYKGQVIQSRSTNHLGGNDYEYIAYNFAGKPTKHLHEHQGKSNATLIKEQYSYEYDNAQRLKLSTYQLNDGSTITLSENEYDELGRLSQTISAGQKPLEVTYAYNIRSWTDSITNPLYSQQMDYTLNGNIDWMKWTQNRQAQRGYDFKYDGLSRLKTATSLSDQSGDFSASYTYDKHGNMKTLSRMGVVDGVSKPIDNLAFGYNGNQLKETTQGAERILKNNLSQFRTYGKENASTHLYNKNGALAKVMDSEGKVVKEITYNNLSLPVELTINESTTKAQNYYTYSATGTKLRVKRSNDPNPLDVPLEGTSSESSKNENEKTTDYVGNFIYENKELKTILLDNGYYDYKNKKYYFYIKDHLGNNRIVATLSGEVEQSNQYYPFGMSYSDDYKGKDNQPYKYNGKELDEEHGLNWYDYSARYYDPIVPRFTSIDPMAEKYYSISPYAYVANNPMKYIDPTGMWTEVSGGYTTNDPQEIERFVNQQKSMSSQIKQEFLDFLGIETKEPTKEGAANLERKKKLEQNYENLTSALNTFNETVTSLFPGGIIGYKLYNDQEITKSDIGWEVAGILPVGKVLGKGGKVLTEIAFLTKTDKTLFRFAKETFKGNRVLSKEATDLLYQVAQGNSNPGKGTKYLFGSIYELRGSQGVRVYYRSINNRIEVLGYSHKGNQQVVIDHLKKIYGK